jgi:hypothetical protein
MARPHHGSTSARLQQQLPWHLLLLPVLAAQQQQVQQ